MYRIDYIQCSEKSYVDIQQLFDAIENGIIKEVRLPDGRAYDVSKVVLVSKDAQNHLAKPDDIERK